MLSWLLPLHFKSDRESSPSRQRTLPEEAPVSNSAMCEDLKIPSIAEPRCELGNVEEENMFESWLPDWASAHRIQEAVGNKKTSYDWLGAGQTGGIDMRSYAPHVVEHSGDRRVTSGGYDQLLKDQANQGSHSTYVPQAHRGALTSTHVPQAAMDSLAALGQRVHNVYDRGTGSYNIDEYSIILDQLPPGYDSPEAFLEDFLRSPNGMANDQTADLSPVDIPRLPLTDVGSGDFDAYNEFFLKEAGTQNDWSDQSAVPGVGDWYHIDIPGNDGDVMIVDAESTDRRSSATLATMTDQEWFLGNDDHPVSGRRQFGIEEIIKEDGSSGGYRFFTRGFDRQTNELMDPQMSNNAQHEDWSALMAAMAEEHGGRAEQVDEDGNPIWGWARQVPAEVMAASMDNPVPAHYPDVQSTEPKIMPSDTLIPRGDREDVPGYIPSLPDGSEYKKDGSHVPKFY